MALENRVREVLWRLPEMEGGDVGLEIGLLGSLEIVVGLNRTGQNTLGGGGDVEGCKNNFICNKNQMKSPLFFCMTQLQKPIHSCLNYIIGYLIIKYPVNRGCHGIWIQRSITFGASTYYAYVVGTSIGATTLQRGSRKLSQTYYGQTYRSMVQLQQCIHK